MAALTAGGALLSASLQVLFDKLTSPTLHEFGSLWGVEHELSRLRRTLLKILSVVGNAEMRQITDRSTEVWLKELKDVAYAADDVLDEFEAEVLRQHVESGNQVSYFSALSPNQVIFRHEISRKINAIRERLDDVAKDRDNLNLGDVKPRKVGSRESSSLVDKSCTFGRDEDVENIIQVLVSGNTIQPFKENVPVVLIAGMAGIGKTTVAKLVYNDEITDSYFNLKIWVHVSERFCVKRISKEIMEYCCGGEVRDFDNWNLVQVTLREKLRQRKLLLVLDNVWNVEPDQWQQLCLPLMYAHIGSRILITTRHKKVANITRAKTVYCLECLPDEDCWQIFRGHAFVDATCDRHPKLEKIGKEIVHKAKGIPLAAKALGGLLYSSFEEESWRNVLQSEIWELPLNSKDVLSALRLSYQYLPANMKQSFAYCSLFPRGYKYEKSRMIQIWMAQGFVQPQGRRPMEDVGNEFFDELVSIAFFNKFDKSYIMHDMIHNLARFVSLDECFAVGKDELHKVPEKARHLSLVSDHLDPTAFKEMYRFKNLRSLLFFSSSIRPIPEELFVRLTYIRVLDMSNNGIEDLPNSIGNLKHLRYLDLSCNSIARLPESVGQLHNLQTLNLDMCPLSELPKGMTNLINLRHLKLNDDLVSLISGIGRLIKLQELANFKVHKERGHRIAELKGMAELRRVHISDLENVTSMEEARDAMLISKEHLRILTLEWNYSREISLTVGLDEKILEGLQPHPNLKGLNIWDNSGGWCPSWLRNQFLSNLESVSLRNCKNWEFLPSLGQLSFLRYLEISGMDKVKRIDRTFYGSGSRAFPSLVELRFVDMPEWEEWLSPDEGQPFPRLQDILIVSCPKLLKLPPFPPTLTRLWIRKVGLQDLPDSEERSSPSPSCLTTLEISECPNLTSLGEGLLQYHLTALESLTIIDCPELVHSPAAGGFPALAQLKSLTMENCPKLAALLEDSSSPSLAYAKIGGFPDFKDRCLHNLTSLYSLSISDCSNISSLPEEALCNLTALEELTVSGCKGLTVLHFQALVSLKRLTIENCPVLESSSSLLRSSSLEYLEISNSPEIAGLLQNLTCLLALCVNNCPQLTSFVKEEEELRKLESLQTLHIHDCINLKSLPAALNRLTSLERLHLRNCPLIESLPESGLPTSLVVFDVRQCPRLEVRCRKDNGPDWSKIAHIPNLYIVSTSDLQMSNELEERASLLPSTSSPAAETEIGVLYGSFLY